MARADRVDQPPFVRKILIHRADADASGFGDLVGREASPASIAQNASSSADDDFYSGPRARLARLFAHGRARRGNASRHWAPFCRIYEHGTHILRERREV